MIRAVNLYKSYGNLQVLKGIDLEVRQGEIVSIVGASGAGKSTLLHILGTLDQPDQGEVFIDGEKVADLKGKPLARFRNQRIGFVFQFHHLLPEFTALENTIIPALIGGMPVKKAQERGRELLQMLGLENRLSHKPAELSGGEQQRVAVARALINQPAVVLADEPSGNLDSQNSKHLHSLFFNLREKLNQTFIIATHNSELAEMADRKLTMIDGKIVYQ